MSAVHPHTGAGLAPLRAASIARRLLGLVESGYFERRPIEDEQITARWLTHAIAELDRLRIVREPTPILDRLDALLIELAEFPDPQTSPTPACTSQVLTAN
jgi:DNA-binding IclR family transcriptional regulator